MTAMLRVSAFERQHALVSQQHRAFAFDIERGLLGSRRIGRTDVRRIVDQPGGVNRSQDAMRHVVEPRLRRPPFRYCLRQRRPEEVLRVELRSQFLIESREGGGDRRVRSAPIRHDEAGIAPIALEHGVEQPAILASVDPVDLIVGAHHRAGTAAFDRDFKRQQIGFARRPRIDTHVERAAIRLLIVESEMLDGREDMPALGAGDRRARHHAREQWVFREILEIAAAARIANEVHGAAEQDIEAAGARLTRHRFPLASRQRLVPSRGERQIRRHRGRAFAAADIAGIGYAEFAVGLLQSRHAEARRAGHEASRTDGAVGLGPAAPRRAEDSLHQGKFLGLSHLRQSARGALGGRQWTIVRRRSDGRNGNQRKPESGACGSNGVSQSARRLGDGLRSERSACVHAKRSPIELMWP